MDRLSAGQARRIALAAQGFSDPRPSGRVDARHVRRALASISLLQIDSVNVLVRSHELPLFSRLGAYPRDLLPRLAYRDRELFEYWGHAASYLPVAFEPLVRWRKERASALWQELRALEEKRPGYVEGIYQEVADRGPIAASELSNPGKASGPWWGWAEGKATLEYLFGAGRIGAAHRRPSFERAYDVIERVIPPAVLAMPTPLREEAQRALLMIAARSMGVATKTDLGDYFHMRMPDARPRIDELAEDGRLQRVEVEGWPEPAYLYPGARLPRWVRAQALLSPFDSLVWERSRTERLFGFRLRLEIYTPAPKRVFGYYVLPFLLGDRLVGRIDLKSDRKESTLRVLASYAEPGEDQLEVAESLADELGRLAGWLGLERVAVSDRGDLGPALVHVTT